MLKFGGQYELWVHVEAEFKHNHEFPTSPLRKGLSRFQTDIRSLFKAFFYKLKKYLCTCTFLETPGFFSFVNCICAHHKVKQISLQGILWNKASSMLLLCQFSKYTPDYIVFLFWQPLCATDPMLVLEFSLPVLESCPMQTIELFLSGNIPADLVNSYLKQHAPNMQATYLELMLAMNENSISRNLQNEMVGHLFISLVFL